MKTPVCDFLREYGESGTVRMHMPGHKGKPETGCDACDLTEIEGADELYRSRGILRESEENAASLFGTGRTVYSAEGSSLCIRAMLYLASLRAAEEKLPRRILAGRNAHKTLMTAAALLDIGIDWVYPEPEEGLLSCGITAEKISEKLNQRAYMAVYVTTPDYLGHTVPVRGIADACRRKGVPLLADNAHGAYLRFLAEDRHPVSEGADLCCDSAHKTLPCLTGAAYLHISKHAPESFARNAERAMALFASTSPSYLILQSLDRANAMLAGALPGKIRRAADRTSCLRAALEERGEQTVFPENELVVRQPKPQVAAEKISNTAPRQKIRIPNQRAMRIILDIVLALAVLAGLFFGGKAIYEQTIFTVKVPDVMGMNIDQAVSVLKQAGLTETHKAMPSDTVELNQVYVQNPEAETTVRKGDAVILVISSGPVPFEMPDVVGKTAEEATTLLNAKKMTITRDRAASTDVPKGSVMSQVPAAGEQVTRDDPVTLTISGGSTVVPSLQGCTLQKAEEMLSKQNLTLMPSLKYVITDNEEEHGLIASSSPEGENRVAEDTPVQLTLYRYPEAECTASLTVTVPESDQQLKVKISIMAEQSNVAIDSRTYTVEPEDARVIEETVDIPDGRTYTYTVYINDSQQEQKILNTGITATEETGNE